MHHSSFLLSFLCGILFLYLSSALFFRRTAWPEIIATLFLVTAPIPFFAYTSSRLIAIYVYTVYPVLSILGAFVSYQRLCTSSITPSLLQFICFINSKKKSFFLLFGSTILGAILLKDHFPSTWFFESHDLLYYGWLNEALRFDYHGPIRVGTAYPAHLSANHLAPGALLLPFLLFTGPINIFYSLCVKYLLLLFTLVSFIFTSSRHIATLSVSKSNGLSNLFLPLTVPSLALLFFFWELSYNISISSFAITIAILSAATVSFSKSHTDSHSFLTLLVLFCIIPFAKATTFPVYLLSLLLTVVYIYKSRQSFFSNSYSYKQSGLLVRSFNPRTFLLSSFLIIYPILSIASWVIPPSQHGSLALAAPLCYLTATPDGLFDCFSSITANPFSGWVAPGRHIFLSIVSVFNYDFSVFFYVWFLILLPCYFLSRLIFLHSRHNLHRIFAFYSLSVVFLTSIAIVFLRESIRFSGMHTAHSYLICSMFNVCLLVIAYANLPPLSRLSKSISMSIPIVLLFLATLFITIPTTPGDRLHQSRKSDQHLRPVITYHQSLMFDNKYCLPQQLEAPSLSVASNINNSRCANDALIELIAALRSERVDSSLRYKNSVIRQWSIH